MAQSKRFCGTLNGYDDLEVPPTLLNECSLLVFSEELGDSGNNPHLQIYLETKTRRTVGGLRTFVLNTSWHHTHWEIARGTPEQCIAYLKKEDGHVFHTIKKDEGVRSAPNAGTGGGKVEWNQAYELAKTGGAAAVGEVYPKAAICHFPNLEAIHKKHRSEEDLAPLTSCAGLWVYGNSGSGKTTLARALQKKAYLKVLSAERWDGWKGQQTVIFEDVDKTHAKLAHLFKVAGDRFAFPIQVIYEGAQQIRPKIAVATSQYKIEDIWGDHETRTALNRRFATLQVKDGERDGLTEGERRYVFTPATNPSTSAQEPQREFDLLEDATLFLRAHFSLTDSTSSSSDAHGQTPSGQAPTTTTTTSSQSQASTTSSAPQEAPNTPYYLLFATQVRNEDDELDDLLDQEHVDLTQDDDE